MTEMFSTYFDKNPSYYISDLGEEGQDTICAKRCLNKYNLLSSKVGIYYKAQRSSAILRSRTQGVTTSWTKTSLESTGDGNT